MKKAYLFLAEGFEITEALSTADILRRAEIETILVSINETLAVKSSNNIVVLADCLLNENNFSDADAVILPGGMPGALNLWNCEMVRNLVLEYYQSKKTVAAICAAPLNFGRLGILEGKNATCYPGFETELKGATVSGQRVTVDENIITAKGAGCTFEFGFAIVESLLGKTIAQTVAEKFIMK